MGAGYTGYTGVHGVYYGIQGYTGGTLGYTGGTLGAGRPLLIMRAWLLLPAYCSTLLAARCHFELKHLLRCATGWGGALSSQWTTRYTRWATRFTHELWCTEAELKSLLASLLHAAPELTQLLSTAQVIWSANKICVKVLWQKPFAMACQIHRQKKVDFIFFLATVRCKEMSLSRDLGHYYKLPKSDSNAVYLLSNSVYYLSTLSGNSLFPRKLYKVILACQQ